MFYADVSMIRLEIDWKNKFVVLFNFKLCTCVWNVCVCFMALKHSLGFIDALKLRHFGQPEMPNFAIIPTILEIEQWTCFVDRKWNNQIQTELECVCRHSKMSEWKNPNVIQASSEDWTATATKHPDWMSVCFKIYIGSCNL